MPNLWIFMAKLKVDKQIIESYSKFDHNLQTGKYIIAKLVLTEYCNFIKICHFFMMDAFDIWPISSIKILWCLQWCQLDEFWPDVFIGYENDWNNHISQNHYGKNLKCCPNFPFLFKIYWFYRFCGYLTLVKNVVKFCKFNEIATIPWLEELL